MLAFYALVGQLYAPIVRLSQFQATAIATQVSVERLYEIFDEPEPVRDRPDARPLVRPRGRLEYRGVRFAYPRRVRDADDRDQDVERTSRLPAMVLDGVDLEIEPGMRVGILGPSGRGSPRSWPWPPALRPPGRVR
ncbi:MAG: hypothetical protein U0790_11805 [Isosphaeraceae bacterium]